MNVERRLSPWNPLFEQRSLISKYVLAAGEILLLLLRERC